MPEIRDPIHGFIHFDDRERALIDSRPVQRLKHIHQLALGYLLYPGATHSRFEHSIGTMELAGRAFDAVCRNSKALATDVFKDDADKERWRAVVRIAGLLHDIGHPPFSHAGDDSFDPSVGDHEEMTRRLISSTDIAPILDGAGAYRVSTDEVAFVASGMGEPSSEAALLAKEIITGDLGVDRMDYLLRDSQMCGVNYGLFDLARLIETLALSRDPDTNVVRLALQRGGLHAAEGLLTARYFMFSQVYFHPVRAAYDAHLERFLSQHLEEGTLPTDLDQYLALDDISIIQGMRGSLEESRDARAVVNRDHFKLVRELRRRELALDHQLPTRVTELLQDRFDSRAFLLNSQKDTVHLQRGDITVVDTSKSGQDEDILDASETLDAFKPIWFVRVYSEADISTDVLSSVETLISDVTSEVSFESEDAR